MPESNPGVKYLRDFGKIEAAHRDFFIRALGSSAITSTGKPFAAAKFDFNFDDTSVATNRFVLDTVLAAEKTGVGAYIGAIDSFVTTTYLQTAAAIQGTEARHTAIVIALINRQFGGTQPVAPLATTNNGIDAALTPDEVLRTVSPFIVL
ncbi:ferritin-like domain-containing protein [bacterium]|nr:MAG: ferritin-like domain-containing protein [bacterium]